MEPYLKPVLEARKVAEVRAMDYHIATYKGLYEVADIYGPMGPMAPKGSYIYELQNWNKALKMLTMGCNRNDDCEKLLDYVRHPDKNHYLPVPFQVFQELKRGCELGKLRNLVPSEWPAWCHPKTGQCENTIGTRFWGAIGKKRPWKDDPREEYQTMKDNACPWVNVEKEESTPLTQLWNQDQQLKEVERVKPILCKKALISVPCQKENRARLERCNLPNDKFCPSGKILPEAVSEEPLEWKPMNAHSSIIPTSWFI